MIWGPILLIALVFGVYFLAQYADSFGTKIEVKEKMKLHESEYNLKSLDLQRDEIQLKRDMLEFERERLKSLPHHEDKTNEYESTYKVIEDKRDEDYR